MVTEQELKDIQRMLTSLQKQLNQLICMVDDMIKLSMKSKIQSIDETSK